MIKSEVVVLIFIILILLIPNVKANEDQVYLYVKEEKERKNLVVFVGEYDVYIKVIFRQNCSNWGIEIRNPLFAYPIRGIRPESVTAGSIYNLPLTIDPNAPIGKYPITVYFNYTNTNNLKVSNQFNFTIEYKKSFEIKELNVPKGNERLFSLTIETFVNFTELNVEFDSDGDIETKKHEIILEDISAGNYTFETSIYKLETNPGDAQELGYWIIGVVDNRTVEFGESNIPVNIEWGVGEGFISGFETLFLLISFLILINWLKKKKK